MPRRPVFKKPAIVPFGTLLREIAGSAGGSVGLAEVVSDVVGAVVAVEVTVVGPVTKEVVVRPDDFIVDFRKVINVAKSAELFLSKTLSNVSFNLAAKLNAFDINTKALSLQFSRQAQVLTDRQLQGIASLEKGVIRAEEAKQIEQLYADQVCDKISARLEGLEQDLKQVARLPVNVLSEAIATVERIDEKLRSSAEKIRKSARMDAKTVKQELDAVGSLANASAERKAAVQLLLFLNSATQLVNAR